MTLLANPSIDVLRWSIHCLVMCFLLFLSLESSANDYSQCNYIAIPSEKTPQPEWQPYSNCAKYINGNLKINPAHLSKIYFAKDGIAPFTTAGQMFYIKPDGSFLPVILFDNGPDYFSEGLVRSLMNGKIAYYNRDFKQVIAPKYDWGWPFEQGRALVCIGCSILPPDNNGHKALAGGRWGYIDRQGKEIVPVKYSQQQVYSK